MVASTTADKVPEFYVGQSSKLISNKSNLFSNSIKEVFSSTQLGVPTEHPGRLTPLVPL